MCKYCATFIIAAIFTAYTPTSLRAQHRELTSEITGQKYVFYAPGKAPAMTYPLYTTLRLAPSPAASPLTVMNFTLQVEIYQDADTSRATHEGLHWTGETERGSIRYIPRFTLTARNQPIELDTVMVIEYFSQDVTDRKEISREHVEYIPLLAADKGQTIIFDGSGVTLYKAEHKATDFAGRVNKVQRGVELLGAIISIKHANAVLFQQYAPSALAKYCSANLPPATPVKAATQDDNERPNRPWRRRQSAE